jgi:hypothetical protein
MLRVHLFHGVLVAACCLTSACGQGAAPQPGAEGGPQPPGAALQQATAITTAQAQTAIDEWLQQPNVPNGSAVVVGVRDVPGGNGNWVVAELRTRNFTDIDGHISPTEDPALAQFARGGSGLWMLTRVTWDGGRVTAAPDVVVP